ncbi:DUF4249 domain-containing protein [Gramella sp. AN32]|uniref:DUF4249 domain-containing protein n=1 Tax=Christiangramia antarctica TaxID=2058158 RepID=A0ABW5X4T5_9FLAO|nr:DUF4249 domain-containing protein [Gramella sp. AN32]MCM4156203.1 hypothetical protein [Gramella sp. AN32]
MMKMKLRILNNFICLLFLVNISCVEEIPIEAETFESLLVIEGIVTDELKTQQIKISKTYPVDEDFPESLSGANVRVRNSNGSIFSFSETSPGIYESTDPFQAQIGIAYVLEVETPTGFYESTPSQVDGKSQIDELKSFKTTNNFGEVGVGISVSSSGAGAVNKYYKIEYEETYKIQAPYWKCCDLIIDENDEIVSVPKTREEYICYNTLKSQNINLATTNGLSENNLDNYLVNFISKEDVKLAYRYSLLVKQLEIGEEAYSYYETLSNLSENESIFSQYQPGFLSGNIKSSNTSENVIGFFTVATVDTERIFYNYTDYFDPTEDFRPLITAPCDVQFYEDKEVLKQLIKDGRVKYFSEDPPGVFKVIRPACVDCNYFGTNQVPEFWTEE